MLLPVGSLAVLAAVEPCLTAAALAAGLGTHAALLGHDDGLGFSLSLD